MLKLKRVILSQVIVACCLTLFPLAAFAGGISLVQVSPGSFNIVANGISSAAGYHLTIGYEAPRLSGPRVVRGPLATGAMFVDNPNVSGQVQVAAIKLDGMASNGVLATINFNQTGDNPGALSLSGYVVDTKGKNIPSLAFNGWSGSTTSGGSSDQADQSNQGNQGNQGAQGNQGNLGQGGSTTQSGGTAGGTAVVGGSVTMPTDDFSSRDRREASGQAPHQEPRAETAASVPATAPEAATVPDTLVASSKVEKFQPRKLTAVLDRFRLYAGDKTPANLLSLFQREPEDIFAQQPTVVVTDGTATVTVTIPKLPGDKAPNFSFSKARFVGLRQAGDGEWLLEVLPEKGVLRASVSLIAGEVVQEIPLTVVPKVDVDLDKSGAVTDADFQLFLKNRGTAAAPKYDLNGDGKRDYQDEFVFAANYLVQKARKEAPAAKKP